jgi:ubiquinone/menaquinone biosynthesis C-methylase UbiE
LNKQWFREVEQVRNRLGKFKPSGKVLELACGTGLWTQQLLDHARQITAVDAATEVLQLNQQRLHSPQVKYIQANIFTWQPDEKYDVVFFSFWLSHVPPQYFESFWQMVSRALEPGGRVFFIDSKYAPSSTALDQQLGSARAGTVKRLLNDGREYQIVKIFYEPRQLEQNLGQLGWSVRVSETPNYFLFGDGGKEM